MELGKKQLLKIVRKVEFGVYLGTKEEQVLLPKKQVPENAQEGDEVSVFIYRDSEDRLIATTNEPKLQLGETAVLNVKDVSKNGAYLDWGLEKDLFLPFKEQIYEIAPGDEVLVAMYIDKSNRLCATMKVYDYLKNNSLYEEEDVVQGIVYNFNPQYGAFVAVEGKYHGLIQVKELTKKVKMGETLEARVKSVRPDGKLDLALRKKAYLQIDDDAQEILRFLEEHGGKLGYTDKAKPEIIRRDFHMSKNEFKRAIGRLLKEGRVSIGENNIFLTK
ncbi:MAG: S1 RNA-binding domain-containing protein [Eubacterium sp.]|nr:S1 RNA-binding domain-containing protein [Eubacterium sp.]